jgi:hypothetical protein
MNPHTEAEEWILEVFLPKTFGQKFRPKSLGLQSRGETKFAAVSDNEDIVAMISTSCGMGSNGKVDRDALMKVRSDSLKLLWLEHTPAKRLMILTDPSMIRVIREEIRKGHFPKEMEILRVKLPAALATNLEESQKSGSGKANSQENSDEKPE